MQIMKNYKFEQFINYLQDKKVAFLGLGVSHIDTIKMMAKYGINITVRDKKNIKDVSEELIQELNSLNVKCIFGSNYLENITENVVFRTPGMNFNHPIFAQLHQNGVIVTSEMEVFFDLCPCKILGVTGSDGKTTTSTLISLMLEADGCKVYLGGNIGKPLLPIIESINPNDYVVTELSSFQLISMRKSPNISVITNIAPNHLDVHKDMEEYVNSKKNIFFLLFAMDKIVINLDDNICRHFADETRSIISTFSHKRKILSGAFVDDNGDIYLVDKDSKDLLFNTKDIILPGEHNIDNYLAAIVATQNIVSKSVYKDIAKNFKGVEHRIEFVKEINGVKWYNDSIATSPTRTIAGLKSFKKKVILIAGGYDKHIPYEPLVPHILDKVKQLILTGDTSESIYRAVVSCEEYSKSDIKINKVKNLEEAVNLANQTAVEDDIVLLSPASASFDCYKNFEARGTHFKKLVCSL